MMGAATVIANFTLPGDTSQVAARLLDVAPDGTGDAGLRGLWRPATGGPTKQVFQLHPNGWNFAEGHVPKLELLPGRLRRRASRGGYGRASDGQQPVAVSDLELRLPVLERPGRSDGLVGAPATEFLPDGYELAADFAALSHPHPKLAKRSSSARARSCSRKVRCPAEFAACNNGKVKVTSKKPKPASKKPKVAKGKFKTIAGGKTEKAEAEADAEGKQVLPHASRSSRSTCRFARPRRDADDREGEGDREEAPAALRCAERPRTRSLSRTRRRSPTARADRGGERLD